MDATVPVESVVSTSAEVLASAPAGAEVSALPATHRRPPRADALRNTERLLGAATAEFAEHGSRACLEDIADRAGVGIGTLYRHFPNRRVLAVAVFRDQVEALCAQAQDLLSSPSPEAALITWLRSVVRYSVTKRGLAEFLQAALRESGEDLAACRDRIQASGAPLLIRAQQAGVVRADVDISDVLRLTHAVVLAADSAPGWAERTDHLLSVVLDGLRRGE